MLPEDATDPYLESTPLIIGRHYRTPNPHNGTTSRTPTPPVSVSLPSSPTHATSGTLSAPSTPPHSNPHQRPSTPPPFRAASPHPLQTTPPRQRATTPPPQVLAPLPQRALTPPPPGVHAHRPTTPTNSPREIHFPRSQSPHHMSPVILPSVGSAHNSPVPSVHSPAEMSTEVSVCSRTTLTL